MIVKDKTKTKTKSKDETLVKSEDEKNLSPQKNAGDREYRSGKRTHATLHEACKDIRIVARMPIAKRLRLGPKDMRKPLNRVQHELWHSRIVKVWASGDVYFWIPSEETRLGTRMGANLGCKLKAKVMDNLDDPRNYTIEFALDGIKISYGNDVIWHKSVAGLASVGDGKRLLEQLDRELKAQGIEKKSERLPNG